MPKNSVLSIADVRGVYGTPDAMNIMKGITAKTKVHVRRRAMIGIVGVLKKYFLKLFTNSPVKGRLHSIVLTRLWIGLEKSKLFTRCFTRC
jgi:hypothetical protein